MSHLSDAAIVRLRGLVDQAHGETRYELGERIGEGGMGTVYVAHDRELHREVALKVLRAAAPSPEERERIIKEARILASLEHPGIVPVHDVGTLPDGRLFYVMKRVRGERFDDFAHREHSRTKLLRAFLQICDAVAFAHAAGVIHRDLKPQNVMLGEFGEVLVLDWGVAKSGHRRLAQIPVTGGEGARVEQASMSSGTAAGTPGYMAPEQLHGAGDERTDVFGLGSVLFFLLTRAHPSPLSGTGEQWPKTAPVPAALRAICERARAEDQTLRYQSVPSMAADVVNYLDAMPVAAHAERLVERIRRVAIRHRTAIGLVLAYLIVRIAMLVLIPR